MDVFINIIEMVITVLEYISFTKIFFNQKVNSRLYIKVSGLVGIAIVIVLSGFYNDQGMIVILQIISTFVTIYCLFDSTLFEAIKIWLIAFPMLMMIEYVPYMFMGSRNNIRNYIDIISISMIIVLIWLYYLLTKTKYPDEIYVLKGKAWIFISIELFSLLILVILFTYPQVHERDRNEVKLAVVVISIVCIVILNLLVFRNYNAKYKYRLESEYLDKYSKHQREYFELLLSKEEETRRFRHDINNEVMHLKSLLKSGDYDEAYKFTSEMGAEIAEIKEKDFSVGNKSVDIMLNHILLPVKDMCKIEVKGVLGDDISMSERDLCILISNLLTNAVEEIQRDVASDKFIKIFSSRGKNNAVISVENSIVERGKNGIRSSSLPDTTKDDKRNHGIGLRNVKKVVEQSNGIFRIDSSEDSFIAEVYLRYKSDR